MREENDLAKKLGVESPIHPNIEATHDCYNRNVEKIINNLGDGDMLFIASHNADSLEKA